MDFQIVSDLHIETEDTDPDPLKYITPVCDKLILAGDIGTFYKYNQLYKFIEKICKYFKVVIYVLGNHEYYYCKDSEKMNYFQIKELIIKLKNSITNLYILDKSSLTINDFCIVGCTLWSNLQLNLPKFIVKIHGMTSESYLKHYINNIHYISYMNNYCKEKNLKLIVITHYVPSYNLLCNYKKENKYASLYASNLDDFIRSSNIHTWIYGHCHYNSNKYIGNTNMVSNQKGKPKDNIQNYSKEFILKIKSN